MRILLLILTTCLALSARAQHVVYAEPETGYENTANYDIIGKVGQHYLIHIFGFEGSEIAVYDDSMHKVSKTNLNFPDIRQNRREFLAFQDKFYLISQYQQNGYAHIRFFVGDGDGKLSDVPAFADSTPLFPNPIPGAPQSLSDDYDRPCYAVVRSEDRKLIMLIHATQDAQHHLFLNTILLDRDLKPVESKSSPFHFFDDGGLMTEFMLDNDGDLAFVQSGPGDEEGGIHSLLLYRKYHGEDSLRMDLIKTGTNGLDMPRLRVDNIHRRYLINAFYRTAGNRNLQGIFGISWDKVENRLQAANFNPIPQQTRLEARNDMSSPDEILNHFYLRQVFPRRDGGSIVLAEMCYGMERYYPDLWKRSDFIGGSPASILVPPHNFLYYMPRERSGRWQNMTRMPVVRAPLAFNGNKYTEDIMVLFLDKDAKLTGQRVIKKAEFTTLANLPLSYQYIIDSKSVHVLYNVIVRGKYLPYSTAILGDGTLENDPLPYGLDNKHIFLPQFAKQVGPSTAIVPAHYKNYLRFTLMEF